MKTKKDRRGRAVRWLALGLVLLLVGSMLIALIVPPDAFAEGKNLCELKLTVLEGLGAVSAIQTVVSE